MNRLVLLAMHVCRVVHAFERMETMGLLRAAECAHGMDPTCTAILILATTPMAVALFLIAKMSLELAVSDPGK